MRRVLRDAGWSEEQVAAALAEYADVEYAIPVPRPRPQLSARDAFLYLVLFGTLYVWLFNLGSLLFQFIELGFPDGVERGYGNRTEYRNRVIRWAVSALIVAFPVYLYLERRIRSGIAREPARRNSAVRKWLTYLTLALAAGILVGDLISLLNGLLSGSLGVRFLLKVLVVAVIAGGAMAYYLAVMREDDRALNR